MNVKSSIVVISFGLAIVLRSVAVRGQLIYIHGAAFKLIAGLGIPVEVNLPGGSLSWFTNIQAFYTLPDNVTYFEPYKVVQKRSVKNTFNRYTIYQALTKYFDRLGIIGSECIQKIICQVARKKFDGLFGRLIRILFSPHKDSHGGLQEHRKAQWQGLYNESSCEMIYTDCEVAENSILHTGKPPAFRRDLSAKK